VEKFFTTLPEKLLEILPPFFSSLFNIKGADMSEPGATFVWTGSDAAGNTDLNCANWSDNLPVSLGKLGLADNSGNFAFFMPGGCNQQFQIYCYGPIPSGGGADPHFLGFDLTPFDFQGVLEEGKKNIYNIISDSTFQFSAQFFYDKKSNIEGTYMDSFGFMCGSSKVSFTAKGVLTIDSAIVLEDSITSLEQGTVELNHNSNATSIFDRKDKVKSVAVISCGAYKITSMVVGHHLDFHASMNTKKANDPHGVLGQTAHFIGDAPRIGFGLNGEGVIEGTESDYLVKDGLFGTDFTYNRFGVVSADSFSLRNVAEEFVEASFH